MLSLNISISPKEILYSIDSLTIFIDIDHLFGKRGDLYMKLEALLFVLSFAYSKLGRSLGQVLEL